MNDLPVVFTALEFNSAPGISCHVRSRDELADAEVGVGAAGFEPNWNRPRLQAHIRSRLAADLSDSFFL